MKKSFFQFQEPFLTMMKFEENALFDRDNFKSFNIETNTQIKKNEEERTALVSLSVSVGNLEDAPFEIHICMTALFKWEDTEDKTKIDDLLSKNAPSLLISYIRPIIASVTSTSRFPTLNIPFMDFRDAHKE